MRGCTAGASGGKTREIAKFMVTVIFLNQRSMLSEGGNPFCVAGKDFWTANIKLHRDKLLNTWQNPG
jgi:hypothetical protein